MTAAPSRWPGMRPALRHPCKRKGSRGWKRFDERGRVQFAHGFENPVAFHQAIFLMLGGPRSETWKDSHNAWQTGGGAVWVTGTYDVETNQTIWGTGNPVPEFDPTAAFEPALADFFLSPGEGCVSAPNWDPPWNPG
jgi:hypothetical protein